MLVLHLGAEPGRLEEALAVPHERCISPVGRERGEVGSRSHSLRKALPVDARPSSPWFARPAGCARSGRCECTAVRPIFSLRAAIAGNEVPVEQFVVVGQVVADPPVSYLRIADQRCRHPPAEPRRRLPAPALWAMSLEETMPGTHGTGQTDGSCPVAFDQLRDVISRPGDAVSTVTDANHHLRHAVRPADEVAVRIGCQQRHVERHRHRSG